MSVVLDCYGDTDRGKVRRLNEDQFLIAELAKRMLVKQTSLPDGGNTLRVRGQTGYLLVVADGMGGVSGGEIASGLAVGTISRYVNHVMPWFHRHDEGREEALENDLRVAVQACQKSVSDAAKASSYTRMGTTLTMACVLWPRVFVVHAGDSRCYLLRQGQFTRVTTDHTVAQRIVDAGIMTAAQAESAGYGHTLWNCISGGPGDVQPELHRGRLEVGDTLLLCTDGLTRQLSDEQIRMMLEVSATPEDAVRSLVAAANDAGGDDNITVVVARAADSGDPGHDTVSDGMMFLPPL
jgi:serine/threonine protein phosphatase PrpC